MRFVFGTLALLACTPTSLISSAPEAEAATSTHWVGSASAFEIDDNGDLINGYFPQTAHIHGLAAELDNFQVDIELIEGDESDLQVEVGTLQNSSHGTWVPVRVKRTGYTSPCVIRGSITVVVLDTSTSYNYDVFKYC